MSDRDSDLETELLALGGGDPFESVLRASDDHREGHAGCKLYPAGPRVMSLAAQVVRTARPRQVVDLGSGLGYSTLWLAAAAPPGATILGIDSDPRHVTLAERAALEHALDGRVSFRAGEAVTVLAELDGPVDFVHDDAWFAAKPAHYDRVVDLLAPGGILTMPNWFLLLDALAAEPRRDWAEFAGRRWREATREFAAVIAGDARLRPVWVARPPLLIAVRSGA